MTKLTEEIVPYLQSYPSSKKWYDSLNSEETKRVFANRFKQYCDTIHKNPEELIALKIDGLRNIATEKEFQAEDLLDGFLYSGKITDSIAVGVKTAVKSFYTFNRRSLDPSAGKNVTSPEPKQRSPKIKDLIELEASMLNPRDRALIWFISSGSFRDNELTNLNWSDKLSTRKLLEENRDPTRDPAAVQKEVDELSKDIPYYFIIEGSRLKGGGKGKYKRLKHVAFIHWYAAQKLDKYESWIRDYLKTELKAELTDDMPLLISTRCPTIERLGSVNPIFQDASKRAWQNLKKKRFSPQDVRDFLQSSLESAGIHSNIIAPMLAHKVKGTDFHYSNHEIIELLQKFRSALPWMLPSGSDEVKQNTFELKNQLAVKDSEIEDLKRRMKTLEAVKPTLEALLRKVEALETQLKNN